MNPEVMFYETEDDLYGDDKDLDFNDEDEDEISE